jgi:hypothetical protein
MPTIKRYRVFQVPVKDINLDLAEDGGYQRDETRIARRIERNSVPNYSPPCRYRAGPTAVCIALMVATASARRRR